ncbi:MAG: Rrf2 family transcriptional regulator [Candidatus Omnitrophica bacterium]|nr:Rrf2 family transcriptional regulator [Candidatus Omnitrophota bacterium]
MKLINRDTDYAVRAISYIARRKERIVTVPELTRELNTPGPFLRKILQLLNKKGVLISHKGRGGGFVLAREPNEIFLTDVIAIFQGPVQLNECLFKKRICKDVSSCVLKSKIDHIERRVISELKAITISSLM